MRGLYESVGLISLCLMVVLVGARADPVSSARSRDGWAYPTTIPDTYAPNYVDLGVDSGGIVHVVYEGGARVYHQSKQADGAWSTRTIISADPSGLSPDVPYIHVDHEDNLHVAWQEAYHPGHEGEIWYNNRPALLGAWESPVALSRQDMSRCPAVATDSTGTVHVVGLLDASPDKLLYSVKPDGGSWVGPGEIPGVSGYIYPYIDVAVDADGTLHVVFPQDDGLSHVQKPSGGAWSTRTIITSEVVWYGYPRLGVASTGSLHLVWGEDSEENLWYATRAQGGTWTTPMSVPGTTAAIGVDLVLDAMDGAHIVWADADLYEVYYVAMHADGSWSDRQTLTSPDSTREDIGWPHIAIGPDRMLHAIWEDRGQIYYTWAPLPDTIPPSVLATTPGDGDTDVAADASIVILFSEPIEPSSLNLVLAPDPGEWGLTWNHVNTVVTGTHAVFEQGMAYLSAVTADDAAGNPMSAPLTWSFTTEREVLLIYLPIAVRGR